MVGYLAGVVWLSTSVEGLGHRVPVPCVEEGHRRQNGEPLRKDMSCRGKFSKDFNLVVWQMVNNFQINFSPIMKHNVICNTHMHICS